MSKYIVDIDDFEPHFKVDSIGVFGIGKPLSYSEEDYSWSKIKSIEEFEELNSDYINEHYGELQDEAYQAGLNDAWKVMKKIALGPEDGALTTHQLKEIFGTYFVSEIIRERTAQEVIDKIKAYEDKHPDRIEVGDEVIDKDGDTTIVTNIHERLFDGLCSDGSTMSDLFLEDVRKTGRHYDHIGKLLEAIRA